jgi:hypothetical protein
MQTAFQIAPWPMCARVKVLITKVTAAGLLTARSLQVNMLRQLAWL